MSVVGAPLDLITVVKPCVGKAEEVMSWAVDPDNTDLSLWRRVVFDAHGNVTELDLTDCDLDMDLETLAETLVISEGLRVLKLSNNPKLTGDIGCFEVGCDREGAAERRRPASGVRRPRPPAQLGSTLEPAITTTTTTTAATAAAARPLALLPLSAPQGCQFTEVWLGGCLQITGDIAIFSTSPELTDLSLGAPSGGITGLTGDVAVLLDMPSLRRVWLHGAINLTGPSD